MDGPAESITTVDGRRCTRVRRSNPTSPASLTSPADNDSTSTTLSGQAEQTAGPDSPNDPILPGVEGTQIDDSFFPSETQGPDLTNIKVPEGDNVYGDSPDSSVAATSTMEGGSSASVSPIEGVAGNSNTDAKPAMDPGVLIGVVVASVVVAIVLFIGVFMFCRGRNKGKGGGVGRKHVFNLDGSAPAPIATHPNQSASTLTKTTVSVRQQFAFFITRLKIRKIRKETDTEKGAQGVSGAGKPEMAYQNRMSTASAFRTSQDYRNGSFSWDPRRPSVWEDKTGTPTLEPQNYPFLYDQERGALQVMNPDDSRPTSTVSRGTKASIVSRYPSGEGLVPPARTYRASSAPHVKVTPATDNPLPANAAGIILGKKEKASRLRSGSAATALHSHPPTDFASPTAASKENPFSDAAALEPPEGLYSRFSTATSASGDFGDERKRSRQNSLLPPKGLRDTRGASDPFDLDHPEILGLQEKERRQAENRAEPRRPSLAFWARHSQGK